MTDPTPQPAAPQPAAPLTAADDKLWASLAHFGGILWILPSLIIYLVFKDRGERTRVESKEALNWQITWIAIDIISFILGMITVWFGIGIIFLTIIPWILYILNLVFSIIGGVKVNGGGSYRYPVSVRLIK
ncbi:MAG: DUF4870 domain-containing protein [Lacisediminihabitans sp.]